MHFIREKNLPFSLEEVKRVCSRCNECCNLKPRFFKPPESHIIKATQPFERVSIDFVGPKPSKSPNKYLLVIIDEYSRFPFVFPCNNMSADMVIKCFRELFMMFGTPSFVHSDRGAQFLSESVRVFLREAGIAQSHTTPYHPRGNGQCERFNGIIWKAVRLALASRRLPESQWEEVLPEALHSIRSLLCTATNSTPHDRFFKFQRRSTTGCSLPVWLREPGPVLLRRFVRNSKGDPLVDQVHLIEANSHYATVQFPSGRTGTVSTSDLARSGSTVLTDETLVPVSPPRNSSPRDSVNEAPRPPFCDVSEIPGIELSIEKTPADMSVETIPANERPPLEDAPRRSSRVSKVPDRLYL